MKFVNFLRDVVVPIATSATFFGCAFFTYKLLELKYIGGGLATAVLTILIGLFVYHDVRRLMTKIA